MSSARIITFVPHYIFQTVTAHHFNSPQCPPSNSFSRKSFRKACTSDIQIGLPWQFNNATFLLCSFSNLFVTSPTSQLILQPLRRFTYVTVHYPTLLSLLLRHRLFTYVTWRAAHAPLRPPRSTRSDRDSNSGPRRWEASISPLTPRNRFLK